MNSQWNCRALLTIFYNILRKYYDSYYQSIEVQPTINKILQIWDPKWYNLCNINPRLPSCLQIKCLIFKENIWCLEIENVRFLDKWSWWHLSTVYLINGPNIFYASILYKILWTWTLKLTFWQLEWNNIQYFTLNI